MDDEEAQPLFRALREEFKDVPMFDFADLKVSDDLKINTKHTMYTIRFLDSPPNRKRLAQIKSAGKHFFNGRVQLIGSMVKATDGILTILEGSLMVGFPALFFDMDEEKFLQLPATQEVWLNGKRVLPDFSKVPTREK